MVKHIVMWKIKDFAEGKTKEENIKYIKESLENLVNLIPEIKLLEVGVSLEPGFDAVLYSEFNSLPDLQIYQNHPEHKKIAEYIGKVREERVCGDYII
ncbi:MAG: Dabb family protein [Oscillospiraceae bacterium]|nr:Dabb family protein [Oscillospiraceae bacterium]